MEIKMHTMYLRLTANTALHSVKISYPLHTVIYNKAEEPRGFWGNLHLLASALAEARTPTVNIKWNTSGIISIKGCFFYQHYLQLFLFWWQMKHGLDYKLSSGHIPTNVFIYNLLRKIYSNLCRNKECNLY